MTWVVGREDRAEGAEDQEKEGPRVTRAGWAPTQEDPCLPEHRKQTTQGVLL